MVQVLMVEDETELARSTVEYLELCGLTAHAVGSAMEATRAIADRSPDLLLLDINLPGQSGFELCRQVRATSEMPIIFVSARDADSDQILALGLGGDDYIRKPFSLEVLVAKIRRMLERNATQQVAASTGYADDWLRIDLDANRVWVSGEEIKVPATEYRLLAHLASNAGKVVAKQDLLDQLWGGDFVTEGTLSVHVRRLRTRVEPDPDNPTYLRTVWGRGYMFEGVASDD